MNRIARIHPFLFLIASLMYLYRSAAVIASPEQFIRPALILIAFLLLLEFPARRLTGDWDGAALILLFFVLGVCSSWQFFLAAGVASIAILVTVLIVMRMRRIRLRLFHVNALLVIIGLTFILNFGLPLARILPSASEIPSAPASPHADLLPAASPPDIYYIVLDGYVRADILNELYQFNNSEFIESLEALGFMVPTQNHSNYPKTALSVTSTLNMDYVDTFAPGLEEYPYWWLMSPAMDHSRVRTLLEEVGYTTVSVTSDWGITDNPTVDVYHSPAPVVLNDFENHLLFQTPLGAIRPLLEAFAYVQSYDSHRDLTHFQFETLSQIPYGSGPKFVFVHIVAPHPPFVFDAEGNPIQPNYRFSFNDANDFPNSVEEYRAGYVGQVEYVNRQLVAVINAILRQSKVPPVILLQADHGSGMFTDFESAESTCLKERFSPFAAYYLPGVDPATVPNNITPVNLFRFVFNEYFHANLPVLENRQYYSDGIFLYRQQDVTALVDTCAMP